MKPAHSKKLVCLCLAAAQCLMPAFAQTASTGTAASTTSASTTATVAEVEKAPVSTVPQTAPPSVSALPAPQVVSPDTAPTNQTSTTAPIEPAAAPVISASGDNVRLRIESTKVSGSGQRYPDAVLRVVERVHTGAVVAMVVVGLFLGAGILPPGKEDNRGSKIDTYPHPLLPELEKNIGSWLAANKPDAKFKNPLLIRPDTFLLVYSDLVGANTSFGLQTSATISRKPDSAGWLTSPESVNCSSNFKDEKMELAQWQADDYAEVKKRMAIFNQECIATVTAALPKLLKN